jgi:hypothetical protein
MILTHPTAHLRLRWLKGAPIMIGDVSCRMCQFEQGGVRAFVDQQFRHYAFFASLYRATCNGFCFAQGRRAGRPRRRNAAT